MSWHLQVFNSFKALFISSMFLKLYLLVKVFYRVVKLITVLINRKYVSVFKKITAVIYGQI